MRFIRLIAWKELAHIRADPLMVRLIVVPVLLQLFVIGYALTTEVKNTPVATVDRSNTPQSRSLIAAIRANELFDYRGDLRDERRLRAMLHRGEVVLGLIIPEDFARELSFQSGSSVHLTVDGQDANSSSVAAGYLRAVVSSWTMRFLKRELASRGMTIEDRIPLRVASSVLFNPLLKSSWYMIPALVVILVTMITSLLTGFSIVKEKERGTFEQLMVTPVSPLHVVVGKVIPFVMIGLAEMSAFLILGALWFGIPFRGSPATLLVFALIYMVSSLGIGILTSTLASTSQQVLFVTWFLLIFFIMLSGFFIPIENMPGWVRTVTLVNPVRFFMFVVREIFLKGSGIGDLWKEGAAMLVIGLSVLSLSLATFQRRAG